MANYFVSPRVKTDLRIDLATLASNLESRWPAARIRVVSNPASAHALEWTILMSYGPLSGSLNREGQVVALSGDVRDCAEFAVWARSQAPPSYTLVFYDEGYSSDVEIHEGAHAESLTEPFLVRR